MEIVAFDDEGSRLMSTLTAGHLRQVPGEHLQLAGQGIRDVTRIAASDPVLWRQIISANAAAIRRELEGVRHDLDELFAVLDDPEALERFMDRGRSGARLLPGKHGAHPADWVAVVIETVFAFPGLGRMLFEAASNRDYPLLQGAFLMVTLSILAGNILADLVYPLLDPRVRVQRG